MKNYTPQLPRSSTKTPPRLSLEARIQADVVRYLQTEKVFCHSVPNEAGGRSAVMQVQLISMGMRPGCADLVVWWPTPIGIRIGYLELKNEKGKQSEAQVKFETRCREAHVSYDVVRSVEEVQELLRQYRGRV